MNDICLINVLICFVADYIYIYIVKVTLTVSVTLTVIALRFTILSTLFSLNSFVVTTIYIYIYIYIVVYIYIYIWRNGNAPAPETQGPGFDSWRVSIFSIISLLPFFCAALAKHWKVRFRQG